MCDDKNDCQCEKPENLKTTPDECTPRRIKGVRYIFPVESVRKPCKWGMSV